MTYQIGQNVKFQTRNGSPHGLKGKGIISNIHPDIRTKYLVEYIYIVTDGPFSGQTITSRVMCLESDLN